MGQSESAREKSYNNEDKREKMRTITWCPQSLGVPCLPHTHTNFFDFAECRRKFRKEEAKKKKSLTN